VGVLVNGILALAKVSRMPQITPIKFLIPILHP